MYLCKYVCVRVLPLFAEIHLTAKLPTLIQIASTHQIESNDKICLFKRNKLQISKKCQNYLHTWIERIKRMWPPQRNRTEQIEAKLMEWVLRTKHVHIWHMYVCRGMCVCMCMCVKMYIHIYQPERPLEMQFPIGNNADSEVRRVYAHTTSRLEPAPSVCAVATASKAFALAFAVVACWRRQSCQSASGSKK